MDRFEAMSVLLAVVEAGSLSAGARRLRKPLATVSRNVGELETHLGVRLVLRSSRGLALTDEGRAFVAASRRILEDLEAAEHQAAGDYGALRGGLHVTAPIAFGEHHLLPIALEFLKEQPEINLRLTLADQQISLTDQHIDVALRIGHLVDSALIATRVGTVRRVICASPAYLARRGVPRQPEDLAQHDGISFQGFAVAPEWRYRRDSAAFAIEPRPKLAVNTTEAAIQAALADLGIIRVLSYQVADELRAGQLLVLLPDFAPKPLPVNLIYARAEMLPLKVRCFLDWTVPRLRARMAGLHAEDS
ncbi:LysR family transcriptional regulator [Chelatococcus asaccharovorans]|uniref:LysR family transcriptional regulator n=1 Tax=Chelatococcus asaccharovorans TaxID=28210 RepID=A0A2V3TYP4_9HYPH|nr:LysR family transcriptional regulator [Chelatococcus asaccharovorans]MBS7704742.1 LysR family transcriptional regulator [Chelatococcus asaccharovorans]PXW54642.1 LysR family transcriptional regulator [Chelatococcus asaccharovorans]